MSIQAVAWVLDHSRSRGFARLVLISLANHHNAGTSQCNPGQRLIADEAGISPGSVSAQIAKLVTLGEVVIEDPGGSHRSAQYRLTFAQEVSEAGGPSTRGSAAEYARENESTRGDGTSTRGPEPRGIKNLEPREEPRDELPLVGSALDDDVPHETREEVSARRPEDARAETVASRSRAGRALRATGDGRAKKPRRTDPRADVLVREWWEAQPTPPNQAWPAAVGVVSKALGNGTTEERLRAALRTLDAPLSGGRLDYALGRLRTSRRAEDQDTAQMRDDPMEKIQ